MVNSLVSALYRKRGVIFLHSHFNILLFNANLKVKSTTGRAEKLQQHPRGNTDIEEKGWNSMFGEFYL